MRQKMDDNLYYFGENIKLVGNTVQGYLVRFGNPSDTDLEGDYFTKETDFGRPLKDGQKFALNLYYHHGQDKLIGTKSIGSGFISMDDKGLWMQAQIEMNDEYNKMIMELAKQGKLGYSSGAASHLVERKSVGNAYEIKRWTLAEASLTPRPAESRNIVNAKALKEYYDKSEDEMEEPLDPANIFDGIEEEMLFDSLECLNERLNEAIKLYIEDNNSINLDSLYMDYSVYSINTIKDFMSKGMDVEKEIKNLSIKAPHRPVDIRDAEKTLREAMCLSRSEAKKLANVLWTHLCDANETEEEENETKSVEEQVIVEDNSNIKLMLLKKAMLDLIGD
jgi:HK97 family phage prohead protease